MPRKIGCWGLISIDNLAFHPELLIFVFSFFSSSHPINKTLSSSGEHVNDLVDVTAFKVAYLILSEISKISSIFLRLLNSERSWCLQLKTLINWKIVSTSCLWRYLSVIWCTLFYIHLISKLVFSAIFSYVSANLHELVPVCSIWKEVLCEIAMRMMHVMQKSKGSERSCLLHIWSDLRPTFLFVLPNLSFVLISSHYLAILW